MKQVEDRTLETIRNWLGSGSIDIFGRPFAGKDTQGDMLASLLDAPLIGSGDILRNSNDDRVKRIIGTGKLAPTNDFLAIVSPFLAQPQFEGRPLILSSIGRWEGEQIGIMEAAKNAGHPISAVIYLNLPEDQVRSRWNAARKTGDRGQREDDQHGILDVRLEEFRNKTIPVIDYYREHGLLIEVDGSKSPEEVSKLIIESLHEKSTRL